MRPHFSFILLLVFVAGSAFMPSQIGFEKIQKRNWKVLDAYVRKEQFVKTRCSELGEYR